jgi:hypothetical protein
MKSCLVIYIGAGYVKDHFHYSGDYSYSIDMRENKQNHWDKIYKPLLRDGYKINTLLLTNKHEKINEFRDFYGCIGIEYDDLTQEDSDNLFKYYELKNPIANGYGQPFSGGRFLKLKQEIPEYDIYVIVRADCYFKMGLDELNVKYDKMNWLWRETHIKYFTNREEFEKLWEDWGFFWRETKRVNGNVLNVIPRKYFGVFKSYIWLEHLSLFMILNDLKPLVTLEDVNFMLESDDFFVTDSHLVDNPVFFFNKTEIKYKGTK